MKCPACNAWTDVLETRKRSNGVSRRYECANLHRFTTLDGLVTRIDQEKRQRGRPQTLHQGAT